MRRHDSDTSLGLRSDIPARQRSVATRHQRLEEEHQANAVDSDDETASNLSYHIHDAEGLGTIAEPLHNTNHNVLTIGNFNHNSALHITPNVKATLKIENSVNLNTNTNVIASGQTSTDKAMDHQEKIKKDHNKVCQIDSRDLLYRQAHEGQTAAKAKEGKPASIPKLSAMCFSRIQVGIGVTSCDPVCQHKLEEAPWPELSCEPQQRSTLIPKPRVHLGFMFASPLVRIEDESSQNATPMERIQYEEELENILNELQEAHVGIQYWKDVATLETLQSRMNDPPQVLHFSGHGVANSDRGDCLVIENGNGVAQFLNCGDLHKLLRTNGELPALVFLSCCHSQRVGSIFREAGVRYVVCVKRSERVRDTEAQTFSRTFYNYLFCRHFPIPEAFHTTQNVLGIRREQSQDEENFLLLEQKDPLYMPRPVSSLEASLAEGLPSGDPEVVPPSHRPANLVRKPTCLLGREIDVYNIVSLVLEERVVMVQGPSGIGKTVVAQAVAYFFQERRTFRQGVQYISTLNLTRADSLSDLLSPRPESETPRDLLIVLDGIENLLRHDRDKFLELIRDLFKWDQKIKFVMISWMSLGGLLDNVEKVYMLNLLDTNSAANVFGLQVQKNIPNNEAAELMPERNERPSDIERSTSVLIDRLGGHPQAISLAAALMKDHKSDEICDKLKTNWVSISEMQPLRENLQAAVDCIQEKDLQTRSFFQLLALFPCGVSRKVLFRIWGRDCDQHIRNLQEVSLVMYKNLPRSKNGKFSLIPFVAHFALHNIDCPDFTALHTRCCAHYANKLETIYRQALSVPGRPSPRIKNEANIQHLLSLFPQNSVAALGFEEDEKSATTSLPTETCKHAKDREEANRIESDYEFLVKELAKEKAKSQGSTTQKFAHIEDSSDSPKSSCESSMGGIDSVVVEEYPWQQQKRCKKDRTTIPRLVSVGVQTDFSPHWSCPRARRKPNPQAEAKQPTADPEGEQQSSSRSYGKLLTFYCALLQMQGRHEDARNILHQHLNTLAVQEDSFMLAVLYKMAGALEVRQIGIEGNYKQVIQWFEQACTLFIKSNSWLGRAAVYLALAELNHHEVKP